LIDEIGFAATARSICAGLALDAAIVLHWRRICGMSRTGEREVTIGEREWELA